MLRFRALAVVGVTALGSGGALVAGSAGATGDPEIGTQVLDMLFRSKDGSPVYTPFTISRCQEARNREGFDVEQLICEGLLEGTFRSVTSAGRPGRVNWFCFPGQIGP
jgi:hypothetical protein